MTGDGTGSGCRALPTERRELTLLANEAYSACAVCGDGVCNCILVREEPCKSVCRCARCGVSLPFAAAETRVCWVVYTTAASSSAMLKVSVEMINSVSPGIVVSAKKLSLLLPCRKQAYGAGMTSFAGLKAPTTCPRSVRLQPATAIRCIRGCSPCAQYCTGPLVALCGAVEGCLSPCGLLLPKSLQTSRRQDFRRCRPSTLTPQQPTTPWSGILSKTWRCIP